MSCD
jgi:hypothetical protein